MTTLLVAALLGALGAAEAAPSAAQVRPPIVLITLDTTRADRLGAWGHAAAATPHLDALARHGRRFARCDSASPMTLPSHASLLTGLFPPRHGVRDNGAFQLAPELDTVAELLAGAGYDTGAVVAAAVLAAGYGLGQGFRVYDDDLGAGYARATPVVERRAEEVTDAALALLDSLREPFFLWVHYFDPHDDYRPPAEHGTGYDGEIAYMDTQLGRLLEGLPPEAIVVVAGDHGEMLGEFGEARHGLLPFAAARRVPLLVSGPGVRAGVEQRLVRTVDVAPTLLELAGVPVPEGLDGRSLLPLAAAPHDGSAGARRVSYWESFYPFFAFGWYPLRALSDGERLYVHGPQPTLYDAAAQERVIRADADETAAWSARLEGLLGDMGEPLEPEIVGSETAARRKTLGSLGYLGGSSGGTVTRALPDPRRMTRIAAFLQDAASRVDRGECEELSPELSRVLRDDPENPAARILAARCDLRAGNPSGALQHLGASGGAPSPLLLGYEAEAQERLGQTDKAEETWRRVLAADPANGRAAERLARSLRRRGAAEEAESVAGAALAAGARQPVLFFERGMARVDLRLPEGALADFEEAARRDPRQPEPLANAARLAESLGRAGRAAALYERLLRLQPDRGDLWERLGRLYAQELERREDAIRCLRRALALEPAAEGRRRLESLLQSLSR